MQRELETRIKELFSYWDKNNNGIIDRQEFKLAIQVLGISMTEEDYGRLFDEWDADKNGVLNFKEIRGALLALGKERPEVLEDAHETVKLLRGYGEGA